MLVLPRPLAGRMALLGLIGVVLYGLWWQQAPLLANDSGGYLEVARDLADGRLDQLHFRSPGYPLLLCWTGTVHGQPGRLIFWVSLLLHGAAVWMATAVLAGLGFTRRAALLFAAMLWLPPLVQPAAYVLSENLAQMFLVLAFAALLGGLRDRNGLLLALSGAALGLAALTRPTYQLAAVVLAALLLLLARTVSGFRARAGELARAGAVLFVGSALILGGFALFNWVRFDYFGISPGNLGYSLSTKTVGVLERLPERYAAEREALIQARDAHLVERGSSHTAEQYLPQARPLLARASGLQGLELEALILRLNLILIARAPLHYLLHVFQSIPAYWFPTATPLITGGYGVIQLFWTALHFAWVGFFALQLLVLGGVSLLAWSRRRLGNGSQRLALPAVEQQELLAYVIAAALVGYTMLVSCGVHHGEARFRAPTDFLIVLVCFIGARIWWRWARGC